MGYLPKSMKTFVNLYHRQSNPLRFQISKEMMEIDFLYKEQKNPPYFFGKKVFGPFFSWKSPAPFFSEKKNYYPVFIFYLLNLLTVLSVSYANEYTTVSWSNIDYFFDLRNCFFEKLNLEIFK